MSVKFSAKELSRIVAQPGYGIVNGDAQPQKRPDLSKLLPNGKSLSIAHRTLRMALF